MPFQPINFATIAPQGNPAMRDFMNSLKEGYEIGQTPAIMARAKEKEELANAWQQMLNQEQPEKFKAEMTRNSLLNSLTQMQMQNARQDRDPNYKVAQTKAFIDALKNKGVNITPEMEAGYYRKSMGLEEQSPLEKMQQQIQLEQIKNNLKSQDDLTTSTKTANQTIIRGVDSTLPVLTKLQDMNKKEDVPGQLVMSWLKRDRQAKYQSMISLITDSLVSAYGLPKTNESLALVKKMVGRQPGEGDESYADRLTNLAQELKDKRKQAQTDLGRTTGTFSLSTGKME